MARVTGGVEGARDAAGRSLEQNRKRKGPAHPRPASLLRPSPSINTHTYTRSAEKKVWRGRKTVFTQSSCHFREQSRVF